MSKVTATTTAGVRGAYWDASKLPGDTRFDAAVVTCVDRCELPGRAGVYRR